MSRWWTQFQLPSARIFYSPEERCFHRVLWVILAVIAFGIAVYAASVGAWAPAVFEGLLAVLIVIQSLPGEES